MSPRLAHPAGHRLFARYASTPSARGYCGPPGSAASRALEAVACGHGAGVDVPALARQFSGAWPYQCLIAELAGIDDPLDERVVRAYWTGNELTWAIDRRRLGELLIERFASQAGHYWSHLTADLLDEVTPTHAFHVFGVYPWTRLLGGGDPAAAVGVLESCRIRPAEVLEAGHDDVLVRTRPLTWDGRQLGLGEPVAERAAWRSASGAFTAPLSAGAYVALHWGHVCDELGPGGTCELERWTELQIDTTNQRLDRAGALAVGPKAG